MADCASFSILDSECKKHCYTDSYFIIYKQLFWWSSQLENEREKTFRDAINNVDIVFRIL